VQYDPSCFGNDKSLVCELGFLFHMLDFSQAQALDPKAPPQLEALGGAMGAPGGGGSHPPVQSTNFLRVLRQTPEAVALGLLESKASSVLQRAEAFHRFLLSYVHAELTGQADHDQDAQGHRQGQGQGDEWLSKARGAEALIKKPAHPLSAVVDT
jgi:hypothetical protein